jgi:hypothetical protein
MKKAGGTALVVPEAGLGAGGEPGGVDGIALVDGPRPAFPEVKFIA